MSQVTAAAGSVAGAIAEVERWRQDVRNKYAAEIRDADDEIQRFQAQIASLTQQVQELARHKEELARTAEHAASQDTNQVYNAVFGALRGQQDKMAQRSAQFLAAKQARDAALGKALSQGDVAALVIEYEQFKTSVAPTLSALPASYRSVIEQHHQNITAKLRDHVAKAGGTGPVEIEAEPLDLDVVYAVDAPEGAAELIMLVIPVTEAARLGWEGRDEDLHTWVAARAVQAVYQVCKAGGYAHAQAMFGGHKGLLAVEVELGGGDPAVLAGGLHKALEESFAKAGELAGAKVRVRPHAALVDHLLPPEEDMTDA